jgi:TetR/AcrR family transcriptional repressor of nem operon
VQQRGQATREKILEAAEKLILARGYAGTSLDDILNAAATTKGAFFHHFKGKADLARAVVERYAANDLAMFENWSRQADEETEDPLERALRFLKLLEEYLDSLGKPFPGCVFASFTYEREQFGPQVHHYVAERMERWIQIFEAKFVGLLKARRPSSPATARALAEAVTTLIEGGFLMAKALGDAKWAQRQVAGYRRYLEILFEAG